MIDHCSLLGRKEDISVTNARSNDAPQKWLGRISMTSLKQERKRSEMGHEKWVLRGLRATHSRYFVTFVAQKRLQNKRARTPHVLILALILYGIL